MSEESDLEKEHVHKVYSEIAAHFSDTRFKPWPKIAKFLEDQPTGSLIADVGCGNGKYLGVNPSVAMLGSDICPELVSIGRSRGHEVVVCDCLHLPYRSSLFDSIICIAVIHHLSTQARRHAAVMEMARVLCPGGSMLLYVWAMEQERKKFEQQDVMVPWHLQPKYRGDAKSAKERKPRARKPKKGKRKQSRRDRAAEEEQTGCSEVDSKPSRLHSEEEPGSPLFECLSLYEDVNSTAAAAGLCQGSGYSYTEQTLNPLTGGCGEEEHCHNRGQSLQGAVEQEQNKVLVEPVEESLLQCSPQNQEEDAKEEKSFEDLGYSTYHRYYHVFKEGELAELVWEVPGLELNHEYYDHENWCIIARKTL